MAEVVITPCSRQQCVCGDVTFNPGNMVSQEPMICVSIYTFSPSPSLFLFQSFSCLVESTIGISRGSDHTVTVHIGNFNQSVGSIRINEPINPTVVIINRGSDHTVTVNFNQSVGSIMINEPIHPAVVIGGTIGSIVVVLAIVFLLGFIYFKRRASGKTSQTALTNITYRQEMVKMKGTDETKNETGLTIILSPF